MKKKYVIKLILLLFLCSCIQVDARAGGGGSSGSSSSGGGSGSSSDSNHISSKSRSLGSSLINLLPVVLIFGISGGSISLLYERYKVYQKSRISKPLLKELGGMDAFWNKSHLEKRMEEIFYAAQSAWTAKDSAALKPYLSDRLYEQWRMKLDWMDVRMERNILDRVRLCSSSIVSIYDSKDDEHDMFWACIRGRMVDYTIREDEGCIIDGDRRSHTFIEYWKFIRMKDTFLLDEVLQKDEVNLDAFINLSEEISSGNYSSSMRHHPDE